MQECFSSAPPGRHTLRKQLLARRYSASWDKKAAEASAGAPEGESSPSGSAGGAEGGAQQGGAPGLPGWVVKKKKVPVVYYATRTHSQIAQVRSALMSGERFCALPVLR